MKKKILNLFIVAAMLLPLLPADTTVYAEDAGIYAWNKSVSDPQNASCGLDTAYFSSGRYSARLESSSDQSSVKLQTEVSVQKNKTYNVRFLAKSAGASAFTCTIGSSKHSLVPVTKSYNWTAFDFTYTHLDDSVSVALVFELQKKGRVYIDDVSVSERAAGVRNLVRNPGFELIAQTETSEGLQYYTATDLKNVIDKYSDKSSMPVLAGRGIVADGDLSEWSGYTGLSLPVPDKSTATISNYKGDLDLSASINAAYDDEYLYLSAVVTDDIHSQPNIGSTYWRGDSIQLVLSTPYEDYGVEIGFYLTDGGESQIYSSELEKTEWGAVDPAVLALREKTKFAGRREGNLTYYEMAIPWELKFEKKPQDFLMNILVNDNDGSGRKGYMEWTEGIGQTKSNEKFPVIYPIEVGYEVFGYIDGPKSMYEQTGEQCSLYIYNLAEVAKNVAIEYESGTKTQVQIPAKSAYLVPFTVNTESGTEKNVTVSLSADEKTYNAKKRILVLKNLEIAFPKFEQNQLAELKALVARCEEKNIAVDYEKIDVVTIENFIKYGLEDLYGGRASRARYVYDCLEDLYKQAKANLTAYLDGSKKPHEAVFYNGGNREIKNQAFWAETINKATGEVKKAPVFFSGYLDGSRESFEISQVGANMLQYEVSMSGHIGPADSVRGWLIGRYGGAKGTYTYDDTTAQSGVRSLKISNSSPQASNVYCNLTQKVMLEAGKKYTLSFYAKADGANGCSFRPNGWKTNKISISGTYDWQKFTYEYSPQETGEVELMFVSEDITNALYLDNIRIVEKGTKENLVQHGSFEDLPVIINGYSVNVDRFRKETIAGLREAQKNGVVVDILMSVHYFPTNLLPEEEWKTNQKGFVKFDIYKEKPKQIIEAFFKGLLPELANQPALHSICISNEPTYRAGLDQSNAPAWHEYLRQLYGGDVNEMNRVWNEQFESFEDVPLSDKYENKAIYYDYLRFNDKMFAEWHSWIAGMVKEILPDIPVHSKVMSVINQTDSKSEEPTIALATDPELFAKFTDLNGNDAWNFIDTSKNIIVKNLWYDFLTSIKNAPVFNSEDHVIVDRDERYNEKYAPHIATDIWQGAVHGRSATAIWKWDRSILTTTSASGNIKHRPDAVSLAGKTMLDLNRLAFEVEALQLAKPQVGVFYSYPSRVYSNIHNAY